MQLGKLIDALAALPQDAIVPNGFGEPRSYRGYYDQVAFQPMLTARVSDMLKHARAAIGPEFHGYKGGGYRYYADTEAWIATWGEVVEEPITKEDVARWAHEATPREEPHSPSDVDDLRKACEALVAQRVRVKACAAEVSRATIALADSEEAQGEAMRALLKVAGVDLKVRRRAVACENGWVVLLTWEGDVSRVDERGPVDVQVLDAQGEVR